MTKISVKRVKKEKLQQEVEDSQVSGWNLETQNENVAILTKYGGWGTFVWHLVYLGLTVWWTFGLGNLGYALYSRYAGKQELQIKADLE